MAFIMPNFRKGEICMGIRGHPDPDRKHGISKKGERTDGQYNFKSGA